MKRIRYLKAEWPTRIPLLAKKLKGSSFSEERGEGFVLDRVRNEFLEGRFYEKIVTNETILDPFGQETTYERVTYRNTKFRLEDGHPQIELTNAPRTIKAFVNALSVLLDFGLSVSEFSISVMDWADSLGASDKEHLVIDAMELSGLTLDEHTTAKVILTGNKDVRAAAGILAANRPYRLDKIEALAEESGELYKVTLSETASVWLSDGTPERLIERIRNALPPK